jgi:catechol 2,3-dioxygenase-like lactoylglutathione lyase family enzyme
VYGGRRAKEEQMGLQDFQVGAMVPVNDMATAKEFYEGKLGFSGGKEEGDGGVSYDCGEGTRLHVYPSPGHAGKSGATVAGFRTDGLDPVIDELSSSGVTFEQYDLGEVKTDERGVASFPDGGAVAWFKDPDGNILAVFSE